MPDTTTSHDSGLDRSAILMMTLDEDTIAEVFRSLSTDEVQRLCARMAGLTRVTQDRIAAVMREFDDECAQYGAVQLNSRGRIESMLEKSLGRERAAPMLQEIFGDNADHGLAALDAMAPGVVAEMIRDEHPQIIAAVLVHLEREQAARVLACFEPAIADDLMLRVATFSGVDPAAMSELTDTLSSLLDPRRSQRPQAGGVAAAAELLKSMDADSESRILDRVRSHDDALATAIRERMLVFEDLVELDDTAIRRLLQDVDTGVLAVALKGVSEALMQRFTDNMARRAADMLIEDMEMRGPMRRSQVEAERQTLLDTVRRLADAGELLLDTGDDDYV